jgi:hypothetical protein
MPLKRHRKAVDSCNITGAAPNKLSRLIRETFIFIG